jgi:hypothetical protein
MRRVDVEEAAGAELLDGHLRGGRTHGQRLLGDRRGFGARLSGLVEHRIAVRVLHGRRRGRRLEERNTPVRGEVLHDALRDERERQHEGQRQQDVQRRTHEVEPEVADRLRMLRPEPADESDQYRHAGRRGDEVLHAQRDHLGEVAHRRLTAVALPVRVGREADGRVEGGVGGDGTELLRIERQQTLNALHDVNDEEAEPIEDEHRERVGLPAHPLVGADAGRPIEETLERPEYRVEHRRLALVDARHVGTERFGEREENDQIDEDLQDVVQRHQNHSGLSMATNR